jgi:transposase-like protein
MRPRDREGTFDPNLIQRHQRRFPGFERAKTIARQLRESES